MWNILSSLRDALDVSEVGSDDGSDSDESETIATFPDPLPLPTAYNSRRTRSAGAQIIETAQMIPVITGLIDAVVESTVIRAEIDKGIKDGKEVTREVRDAIRNANDGWEKARKEAENATEQEVSLLVPENALEPTTHSRSRPNERHINKCSKILKALLRLRCTDSIPDFLHWERTGMAGCTTPCLPVLSTPTTLPTLSRLWQPR
jgi:hypothetical protein